jgi:6-phosphogluconolactonase (cycloisomerase 2 family)
VAVQLGAAGNASALGQITYGGCISGDGSGGLCGSANGSTALDGARASDISPDGRQLYVASFNGSAVVVFDRAPGGQITYAGCVSNDGSGGKCADLPGSNLLSSANSVKVSPDGKSVYVSARTPQAVVVFDRAAGGQITYAGCVSNDGFGGLCADVPGARLTNPNSVALSPDGKSVYVPVLDGVTVFDRAPGGQLAYAGCVSDDGSGGLCADAPGAPMEVASDVAVSRDGTSVYVTAIHTHTITAFDRAAGGQITYAGCVSNDGSGGLCADAPGTPLQAAFSVTVSPDDKSVYLAAPDVDTVTVFDRAPGGQIAYAGCVSETGSGGLCADAPADSLRTVNNVRVSPDGRSVYTTGGRAVAVFDRASGGQITFAGCVSNNGSGGFCADPPGTALNTLSSVSVSPDDGSVYATGNGTVSHFFRKTAPQTRIDSGPAEGIAIANRRPSFTFSADQAGATFECSLDGGAFAACASPFATSQVADGAHSVAVRALTGGDADPTPARRAFRVDATGPTVTIVKAPKAKRRASAKRKKVKVRFAFIASEPGSTFTCKVDKRAFKPCSSPKRFKVGRGKHRFVVKATDSLGNTGNPVRRTFRVVKKKH